MKKYLDLTREQFTEFAALPIDTPLKMLNLLKFKKDGGAAQYKKYMQAVTPFFQKSNAKITFFGEAKFTLIGPSGDLEWDKVLIVEYAKKNDFINMIMAEGYPSELRRAALEDSRLIFFV